MWSSVTPKMPTAKDIDIPEDLLPSSKNLKKKISLPAISSYRLGDHESYALNRFEVRRHNGLYWSQNKLKMCVLLETGRLLVYSDLDRGISINLGKMKNVKMHLSEKQIFGEMPEIRGEIQITFGRERLAIRVRGKEHVAKWRKGVVRASEKKLPLSADADCEEYWAHFGEVTPGGSALWRAVNGRRLRTINSLPQLKLHSTQLRRNVSMNDGISGRLPRNMGSPDLGSMMISAFKHTDTLRSIPKSDAQHSFCDSGDSMCYDQEMDVSGIHIVAHPRDGSEKDSGVCSPIPELSESPSVTPTPLSLDDEDIRETRTPEQDGVDWRQKSRGLDLPMLSLEYINFSSLESETVNKLEELFDEGAKEYNYILPFDVL